MKKAIFLLGFFCALLPVSASSVLNVSDTKYSVCAFDSEIKYVDFGSPSLQGQILNHTNMLAIQATEPLEQETTLSVVTANGQYHPFTVIFSDESTDFVWTEWNEQVKVDTLYFSTIKTHHFLCHENITDIICGSLNIIAEHADNISNIVKAKAMDEDFAPCSITMVNNSGKIYPFVVLPSANPQNVNIYLSSAETLAVFNDASVNDMQMQQLGKAALELPTTITDIGTIKQKMEFGLYGLYSHDDVLLFCLGLQNHNLIDYEIDFIKCYVRDKKRSKKITVQEDEMMPIFVYYPDKTDHNLLKGGQRLPLVLFFRRFTIPQKRILCFEVFERNGGRHLQFSMSDKEILKAKQLALP